MTESERFYWGAMGRSGALTRNPWRLKLAPRPPSPAQVLREKARQLILEAEAIERAERTPS